MNRSRFLIPRASRSRFSTCSTCNKPRTKLQKSR